MLLGLLVGVGLMVPSWFKGPELGGVVEVKMATNGCHKTFDPVDESGRSALAALRGRALVVRYPGSLFAAFILKVSPRGREFCLVATNLAYPPEVGSPVDAGSLPPMWDAVSWAVDVFERAGIAVQSPGWAPDMAVERKTWRGVADFLSRRFEKRPTYHPRTTIEMLQHYKLPLPPGLVEEAARWEAEGRLR